MLGVGDGVTDDRLEEGLEDVAGLAVDHGRDTLDTATTGETTDGRLGDAVDVVAEDLAMAFGTSFAESLSSLAACCCQRVSGSIEAVHLRPVMLMSRCRVDECMSVYECV